MTATRVSRTFVLGIALVSVFLLGARPEYDQLKILDLQYQEHNDVPRLVFYANLPFIFKSYDAGKGTLIIETDKADISRIANNYTIGSPIVKNVSVSNRFGDDDSEVTEFIIKFDANYKYRHTLKGRRLFVEFDKSDASDLSPAVAKNSKKKKSKRGRKKDETSPADSKKSDALTASAAKSDPVVKKSEKLVQSVRYTENIKNYEILRLLSKDYGNGVRISINFDSVISRSSFKVVPVSSPARFVIDFHGAKNNLPRKNFKSENDYYSGIRTAQFAVDPYPISRIVFDQSSLTIPRYLIKENWLHLDFGKPDATLSESALSLEEAFNDEVIAQADAEAVEPASAESKRMAVDSSPAKINEQDASVKSSVKGKERSNDKTPEKAESNASPLNPFILRTKPLTDKGSEKDSGSESAEEVKAKPEIKAEEKEAETSQEETKEQEIQEIKPFVAEKPPEKESVSTETEPTKDAFGSKVSDNTATEAQPKPAKAEIEPLKIPKKETPEKPEPSKAEKSDIVEKTSLFDEQFPDSAKDIASGKSFEYTPTQEIGDTPVEKPAQDQQQEPASPALQAVDPTFETREITPGIRRYTGKKVSLVFESIPLSSLILLLGQMTEKNFLLDPSVSDVDVSISLRDIPWDQALDVILDYHGLGKIEENNLIRIASQDKLTREAEAKRQFDTQRALAVPLRQITKPINYAKANDLATILRRNMSQKGEVIVDQRTNTLVISDIPSKVDEHLNLIDALDIPTKQVVIEARIVETTRDFINEFGMQYGFRSTHSQAYGNSTGLLFPNQMNYQGNLPDSIILGTAQRAAINLPAPSANTSILGSFSNLSGSFILDAVLQLAESDKKVRVLSRPRISASNNSRAEIKSGIEVPFQVIQNNTVSIRFREATLKLEVTPHITSDSTVIMDVVVDKSSLGIQTNAGFAIQTRQATSTIRVKDGGVAVIGGVMEVSDSVTRNGLPILKDIPLIGRLFENRLKRVQNTELLIFISPKVIG